ncbi:hypothetical protein [Enterobacter cloacae]|uniref:InvB/SpaK family type III secretion system chaperone n=1 Tax=Enterobacter cloacae TaxID=550 RepID=UPI002FF5814A
MKYDIVALLTDMLSDAGISDILDSDLSNHSTISLNMKDDIPTINISSDDDDVWIWAKIVEQTPESLIFCSANLLPLMLNHNEGFFIAGQPCLYPVDGVIELRAQINEKHLQSSDNLLSLLEAFLSLLQDYRSVLA